MVSQWYDTKKFAEYSAASLKKSYKPFFFLFGSLFRSRSIYLITISAKVNSNQNKLINTFTLPYQSSVLFLKHCSQLFLF